MQTFTQVTNQENDLNAIERGYQNSFPHIFWLAEALQKDAIQNSWDARISKKGENWNCRFSLIKSDKNILIITDKGATGLIGNKFDDTKEMIYLLKSQNPENLARFLNSNWSGKGSDSGGKWGRGKNIFLISSANREFYFDSYRTSDNNYVFGKVYLDQEEKLIKYALSWGEEAKRELTRLFPEINQPESFGTRIIIPSPRKDLLQAITDNRLLEYISNTRWETIKKFNAQIIVFNGNDTQRAQIPSWYNEKLELDKINLKIYEPELIKSDTELRTKKFVLKYELSGDIPENIRGIAIQRGGMTIERIPTATLLNIEKADNIYGWVEMDKDLEKEMYDLENVEHTKFTWQSSSARSLKEYLKRRIREFAQDHKLIEDEHKKTNEAQKIAEEKAIKNLAPLFKKLDLGKKIQGGGGQSGNAHKPYKRESDSPLRISAINFALPRSDSQRINYSEEVRNAHVIPINETDQSIVVNIRVYIVSEDGTFNRTMEEKTFTLEPGSGSRIGLDFFKIANNLKRGKYFFRAKLLCLEDTNIKLPDNKMLEKGYEYDRVNIAFYVEADPPSNSPFTFDEDITRKSHRFLFDWVQQQLGHYIIYYNGLHPKVIEVKNKDELNKNSSDLEVFLTENAAMIAYQIKLQEVISGEAEADKEIEKIEESNDLTKILPEYLMANQSEFLWDFKGGKNGDKNQ